MCESCGERLNPFTSACDPCRADYLAQFAPSDEELDNLADRADQEFLRYLEG